MFQMGLIFELVCFFFFLNGSMTVECLIDEVSGLFCVYSHWIMLYSLSA